MKKQSRKLVRLFYEILKPKKHGLTAINKRNEELALGLLEYDHQGVDIILNLLFGYRGFHGSVPAGLDLRRSGAMYWISQYIKKCSQPRHAPIVAHMLLWEEIERNVEVFFSLLKVVEDYGDHRLIPFLDQIRKRQNCLSERRKILDRAVQLCEERRPKLNKSI